MDNRANEIARLQAEIARLRAENELDIANTQRGVEETKSAQEAWAAKMISRIDLTVTVDGKKEKLAAEGSWALTDMPRLGRYLANCIEETLRKTHPRPSGPVVLELVNDLRRRVAKRDTDVAHAYERISQLRSD